MKLVVAIGGNALLHRGQTLSAANQLANICIAAVQLARVAEHHDVVITHGNGPQVGLLALQSAAYTAVASYPLDVLVAESVGMIGYQLEQEIANCLPPGRAVTTLLSRVEVDPHDPAFAHPTKPVGPIYTTDEARRIGAERGWAMAADGQGMRRVVASPMPLQVLGQEAIGWLLEHKSVVIAAGGGGIPVVRRAGGPGFDGVEAVIDKDLCSSLLARELRADCLVIVTDVDAVSLDWGLPTQRALGKTTPQQLQAHSFAAGSMGPKVEAACTFVLATGKRAVIGSLDHIEAMLAGQAGTQVSFS